jgi:hypothetical protein
MTLQLRSRTAFRNQSAEFRAAAWNRNLTPEMANAAEVTSVTKNAPSPTVDIVTVYLNLEHAPKKG